MNKLKFVIMYLAKFLRMIEEKDEMNDKVGKIKKYRKQ